MKKILLVFAVLSFTSCAHKPTLLNNSPIKYDEQICFSLGNLVPNRQEINYKVKREFAKFPDEKKLVNFYDLNQFISVDENECNGPEKVIESIETTELFFSDTGSVKYGMLLSVDISFLKDGKAKLRKTFEIKEIGEFISGFTATKKKISLEHVKLLRQVFEELKQQDSDRESSL